MHWITLLFSGAEFQCVLNSTAASGAFCTTLCLKAAADRQKLSCAACKGGLLVWDCTPSSVCVLSPNMGGSALTATRLLTGSARA